MEARDREAPLPPPSRRGRRAALTVAVAMHVVLGWAVLFEPPPDLATLSERRQAMRVDLIALRDLEGTRRPTQRPPDPAPADPAPDVAAPPSPADPGGIAARVPSPPQAPVAPTGEAAAELPAVPAREEPAVSGSAENAAPAREENAASRNAPSEDAAEVEEPASADTLPPLVPAQAAGAPPAATGAAAPQDSASPTLTRAVAARSTAAVAAAPAVPDQPSAPAPAQATAAGPPGAAAVAPAGETVPSAVAAAPATAPRAETGAVGPRPATAAQRPAEASVAAAATAPPPLAPVTVQPSSGREDAPRRAAPAIASVKAPSAAPRAAPAEPDARPVPSAVAPAPAPAPVAAASASRRMVTPGAVDAVLGEPARANGPAAPAATQAIAVLRADAARPAAASPPARGVERGTVSATAIPAAAPSEAPTIRTELARGRPEAASPAPAASAAVPAVQASMPREIASAARGDAGEAEIREEVAGAASPPGDDTPEQGAWGVRASPAAAPVQAVSAPAARPAGARSIEPTVAANAAGTSASADVLGQLPASSGEAPLQPAGGASAGVSDRSAGPVSGAGATSLVAPGGPERVAAVHPRTAAEPIMSGVGANDRAFSDDTATYEAQTAASVQMPSPGSDSEAAAPGADVAEPDQNARQQNNALSVPQAPAPAAAGPVRAPAATAQPGSAAAPGARAVPGRAAVAARGAVRADPAVEPVARPMPRAPVAAIAAGRASPAPSGAVAAAAASTVPRAVEAAEGKRLAPRVYDLAQTLNDALDKSPCARVAGVTRGGGAVAISGIAGSEAARDAVIRSANGVPGVATVEPDISVLRIPCAFAELVSVLESRPGGEKLVLPRRDKPYEQGFAAFKMLKLDFTTPEFPSHVLVDYFALDGTVVHLDAELWPDVPFRPREAVTVGRPGLGVPITLRPPASEELIVVTATSERLFDERPVSEPAQAYVEALQPRLAALLDRGGEVEILSTIIQTEDDED